MAIDFPTIEDARRNIAGTALRTPLIRLNSFALPAEIYLKLENLQPIGSFKIRGAAIAIAHLSPAQLQRGVLTASAGNMAQVGNPFAGGTQICLGHAINGLHCAPTHTRLLAEAARKRLLRNRADRPLPEPVR